MSENDGLTKQQRYYQRNKEMCNKRRAEAKRAKRARESNAPEYHDKSVQTDLNDPLQDLMEDYWALPSMPTAEDLDSFTKMIKTKITLGVSYITIDEAQARDIAMDIARATSPDQYTNLLALRDQVIVWSASWGGIKAWPETFEIVFCRANSRGPEKLKRLVERILLHESRGKDIIRELHLLEGLLPTNPTALRTLWNYQQELMITMIEGLTIIQTKLPILRRTAFAVDTRGDLDLQRDNLFGLQVGTSTDANEESTVMGELLRGHN